MVWDGRRQCTANPGRCRPTEHSSETWKVGHAQKFLQPESDWGLEQDSTRGEKTEKEWGFQKNLQTAESRPVAPRLTETRARVDRMRARATRSRCLLRGPTWTMGDYFPRKQVSKQINGTKGNSFFSGNYLTTSNASETKTSHFWEIWIGTRSFAHHVGTVQYVKGEVNE